MKKLDGIRDVFKHSSHRRPTKIFCPRCGSPKIELSKTIGSLEIWLTPKEYYCSQCGYHGIIVMELDPISEGENQTEPPTEADELTKDKPEIKEEKEKEP